MRNVAKLSLLPWLSQLAFCDALVPATRLRCSACHPAYCADEPERIEMMPNAEGDAEGEDEAGVGTAAARVLRAARMKARMVIVDCCFRDFSCSSCYMSIEDQRSSEWLGGWLLGGRKNDVRPSSWSRGINNNVELVSEALSVPGRDVKVGKVGRAEAEPLPGSLVTNHGHAWRERKKTDAESRGKKKKINQRCSHFIKDSPVLDRTCLEEEEKEQN